VFGRAAAEADKVAAEEANAGLEDQLAAAKLVSGGAHIGPGTAVMISLVDVKGIMINVGLQSNWF
jgi:hypothetical protein